MKGTEKPVAGDAPYNGLYEEVTPERVNFVMFPGFMTGNGFHQLMCTKGWQNLSFRSVKRPKRATRCILWL